MSIQAEQQRHARRHWARPGGSHDRVVRLLKNWLPVGLGMLTALLVTAPLLSSDKFSFILDKNKVDVAHERMRVTEALYRGIDSKGQGFALRAGSAVQRSSREPIVHLNDMSARMLLSDGPASLTARTGQYDMDTEHMMINGTVQFEAAGGNYRLTTRDVGIDLKDRKMESQGRVDGRIPIGTFSADHLQADLGDRTVTLNGRANLRIEQNGLKGQM